MNATQDPNSIQHGGDHYKKAGNLQHWDMIAAFGFGWEYYLARASAYLTRVKDQELDPKKAVHFLDKLIALIEQDKMPQEFITTQRKRLNIEPGRYNDQIDVDVYLTDYYKANSIDPASAEATAITALAHVRTVEDLLEARAATAAFAENHAGNAPPASVPRSEMSGEQLRAAYTAPVDSGPAIAGRLQPYTEAADGTAPAPAPAPAPNPLPAGPKDVPPEQTASAKPRKSRNVDPIGVSDFAGNPAKQ
jgi:hypothetical protein